MHRQGFKQSPGARNQRGSVIISVAVCLALIVSTLAVIDLGFLYFYKREYQKAADLAALSGAKRLISLETGARNCSTAQAAANGSAALNIEDRGTLSPLECGYWAPATQAAPQCSEGIADPRLNSSDPSRADAVRAVVHGTPPSWILPEQTVSACAVALTLQPLAQLTIRSGLVEIDSTQSAVLNALVGGLLGGSLSLNAASWTGLLNTDINLLGYLDALALELGLNAGSYDQVLSTDIALGLLLDVAADVLNQGKGSGDISAGLGALENLLNLNLPGFQPLVQLGELIEVGTGLPSAALDLGLNALDLVKGGVMLANGDGVASIDLPVVGVPGIATVRAKIKAIEPPRPSSVGNPILAKAAPYGPNRIYVRTAQVRTLVEIDLGATGLVNSLTNAVSPLLTPIVNFLNTAGYGGLNLLGAVGNLLRDVFEVLVLACNANTIACSPRNVVYAEALPLPLQINLDAAAADARITDYDCTTGKSLTVDANTEVAHLRVGKMSEADVFSSANAPTVNPAAVIEIGYRKVRPRVCFVLLSLLGSCEDEQWEQPNGSWVTNGKATAKKYVISGLGLKVDSPIGSANNPRLQFVSPNLPEIWEEPAYQSIATSSLVASLGATLSNLSILPYASAPNGLLGNLLNGTFSLLGGVVNALTVVIKDALAGILDPILDALLPALGISLANADIGANLTCEGGGAALVD